MSYIKIIALILILNLPLQAAGTVDSLKNNPVKTTAAITAGLGVALLLEAKRTHKNSKISFGTHLKNLIAKLKTNPGKNRCFNALATAFIAAGGTLSFLSIKQLVTNQTTENEPQKTDEPPKGNTQIQQKIGPKNKPQKTNLKTKTKEELQQEEQLKEEQQKKEIEKAQWEKKHQFGNFLELIQEKLENKEALTTEEQKFLTELQTDFLPNFPERSLSALPVEIICTSFFRLNNSSIRGVSRVA